MSFESFFVDLATNLGFGLPDLVLVLVALGCIILFAKDLRVGLVSMFMAFAMLFVLFTGLGWDTQNVILVLFMSMALMAISFWVGGNKNVLN